MLRILWADESDVYGIFTVLRSYESKHRVEAERKDALDEGQLVNVSGNSYLGCAQSLARARD